jgi:hypothetical protein
LLAASFLLYRPSKTGLSEIGFQLLKEKRKMNAIPASTDALSQ